MLFFVAGITGHVGGAAASRLLEEGHQVRTLARDVKKAASWAERGVEVRVGSFDDPALLVEALRGVDGAFLMIAPLLAPSPDYSEAKKTVASFEEALRTVTPPRVVALSSVGGERASGTGNIGTTHVMEESLKQLAVPVALVRAGGFFENYAGTREITAATGVHYSFYTPVDRAVPMIATVDIGNEVARLLTEPWTGQRVVELGSPVSPKDVAAAMEKVLGRPVEAQAIPRERWAATLEGFGIAPGKTAVYEEMMDGFNSGWIHFGVAGTEAVAGTTSAEEFFCGTWQRTASQS